MIPLNFSKKIISGYFEYTRCGLYHSRIENNYKYVGNDTQNFVDFVKRFLTLLFRMVIIKKVFYLSILF